MVVLRLPKALSDSLDVMVIFLVSVMMLLGVLWDHFQLLLILNSNQGCLFCWGFESMAAMLLPGDPMVKMVCGDGKVLFGQPLRSDGSGSVGDQFQFNTYIADFTPQ